ncbi:MAG: hypothetical protein KQH57_06615 [Actinomycetales bacterium]|nr:hypothetical protein [Actinomycetales bacterium]
MRRTFALLLALALLGSVAPAASAAPHHVTGAMELQFNLCWPGPQEEVADWVGTITIDETEYGMAFFNIGTGRPHDTVHGNVTPYEEIWVIYESLDATFDDAGCLAEFTPGPVLLSGDDRGVATLVNGKYRMNGTVEVAAGDFAFLLGRPVHMSGTIVLTDTGAPLYAPGTWRTS